MEERRSFTAEELAIAKSVDLTAVAASLGYTVKKVGRYHTLKTIHLRKNGTASFTISP